MTLTNGSAGPALGAETNRKPWRFGEVPPPQTGRPEPEVVAKAKRRRFSGEYKERILAAADAAKGSGEVGALLRREGLYSSLLATWRRERDEAIRKALREQKRGPKPKTGPRALELQRLERETATHSEELRKARIIIEVQKKVAAVLGRALPELETL